jgi:nucleotide-binding universal stress UspA family protein
MKTKNVLVPLDGSKVGEAVLPEAVELAHAGSSLVLLRAAEARSVLGDPIVAQTDVVREAEQYLAGVAERLRRAGVRDLDTSVWYGPAAESIVDAAKARHVDLILMSSHGRTGVGRLLLGSVAETVLRGTTIPILLIRPDGAPTAPIAVTGARPAEVSRV